MKNLTHSLTVLFIALFSTLIQGQVITNSCLFSNSSGGARILRAAGNTADNPAIGFQNLVSTTTQAQNDSGGGNGIFRPVPNNMAFATNSVERMRITSFGLVGIGTTSPFGNLTIKGGTNSFLNFDASSSTSGYTGSFKIDDTGLFVGHNSFARNITFGTGNGTHLTISQNGKVGVGTQNFIDSIYDNDITHYKLFVKGGILAEEIRVANSWADYVFEEKYKLKPLSEVEDFILKNKHLPNVPSASEIEKKGINVGDMARIQQEKIEELTLYIIEQNKRIEALEKKLNSK